MRRSPTLLGLTLAVAASLAACKGEAPDPAPSEPTVDEVVRVVPSDGLPAEAALQDANNNLDVAWHDGRLFLAFRTAPTHFASPDTTMHVVSSTDEQTWRYEGSFALGTDVREPQLVSWKGELVLYFAVLGDDPITFDPQGTVYTRYRGPGDWDELTWTDDATFIPWRIKELDGTLYMVGYTGGAGVYDPDADPLQISWLQSDDAIRWTPVVPDQPVVLEGGGSETDFVFLDDGAVVAVVRNEAGDDMGFGSKICRAEADRPGDWRCEGDLRKYDSPLLFRRHGRIWLIGRRNVTDTGNYDLERTDLDPVDQYFTYQVAYWNAPKRCALWEVDPDALTVTHALDLPSRGDTCFPEMVEIGDDVVVYNYSSDPDGPDWSWIEGQTRPTWIHRMRLTLPLPRR